MLMFLSIWAMCGLVAMIFLSRLFSRTRAMEKAMRRTMKRT